MTNSINDLDYQSYDVSDPVNGVAKRVTLAPQNVTTAGFADVGASVLDSFFATPIVGSGVTYSQASGSLSVVSGVTANSEFLARSRSAWTGTMRLRFAVISSQRIANNNMVVMLADLIGEALAYTIVNTTTVDVNIPSHGFTALNVGQSIHIGGITGAAGVPGRYAIASIPNVNTVRFTVAGWPASGSGTCTVFGRNYVRNLFTGTTGSNVNFDAQRNGWATGDSVLGINTTLSPGTVVTNDLQGREVFFSNALRASVAQPTFSTNGSRYENIPDLSVPLYVFVWGYNGSTAPASTTTWSFSHLSVEDFPNASVFIQGARAMGAQNPIPVNLWNGGGTLATTTTAASAWKTTYSLNSAASTNATLIVGSAGVGLVNVVLTNNGATTAFVKFYDKATAPTVGTDVPTVVVPVPATSCVTLSLNDAGIRSTAGHGLAITGGMADADTTAVAAGQVKVLITRTN